MDQEKQPYAEPVLVVHELLRDITGTASNSGCVKQFDTNCVTG